MFSSYTPSALCINSFEIIRIRSHSILHFPLEKDSNPTLIFAGYLHTTKTISDDAFPACPIPFCSSPPDAHTAPTPNRPLALQYRPATSGHLPLPHWPAQAARCAGEAPPRWEESAQEDSARGSSESHGSRTDVWTTQRPASSNNRQAQAATQLLVLVNPKTFWNSMNSAGSPG